MRKYCCQWTRKDSKKHPDSTEPHLSDVSGPIDGAEDVADKDNDKDRSRSISTSSQDTVEEQVSSSHTRPMFSSFGGMYSCHELVSIACPDKTKAMMPVFKLPM
jgi:hypothetical protein